MIDLHIHTNHSDGSDDIITILNKSNSSKLELISITDHDNVDSYENLKNIDVKKYYKGEIITGVEIKTTFDNVPIEILGYNIDIEKFKKSECVNASRKMNIQNKYLKNYIKVGNKLGIKCNNDIIITDARKFAAVVYYREISKHPENYDIIPELLEGNEKEFYRNTSGNIHSPFYINETDDSLDISFVINEIHRCGGKAFLAHLFQYKLEDYIIFLRKIIKGTKIDGIECYYSEYTQEQTKVILEEAKKENKLISGGSDYHGLNTKQIDIGIGKGNLNIPYSILKNWY